MGLDVKVTEHFRLAESACPCCQRVRVTEATAAFWRKRELVRQRWGGPVIVSSGYRCRDHNAAVGGAEDSRHLHGDGEDWTILDSTMSPQLRAGAYGQLADIAQDVGFSGVIVYDDHIHVDDSPERVYYDDQRRELAA